MGKIPILLTNDQEHYDIMGSNKFKSFEAKIGFLRVASASSRDWP